MSKQLQSLLEIDQKDYSNLFATIEHDITCGNVPATSLRLHFIRHDAGGLIPVGTVVDTLVSYLTHFCFTAQRRADLGEKERNKTYLEARRLFRDNPTTGQPGELLVYFLIEAVLRAPQVLKKMIITTNPAYERMGSDGVHVRWIEDGDKLEIIFAEAKMHQSFTQALTSAFVSMTDFHNSSTKPLEINYFLNSFNLLSVEDQEMIRSYVEGENKGSCQEVHVCLIGYDWKEYECFKSNEKNKFLAEFETRYISWAESVMKDALTTELGSFIHTHLRFEFFFLPFASVQNFRDLFLASL